MGLLPALGLCLSPTAALAQQSPLPPPEPPQPIPASAAGEPTLRVTTNVVLVPTLVEKHNGAVVYGLKPADFQLTDNGVPQRLRVEEEMDTAPVALVVVVELGRTSVLEFSKMAKLGPLLDPFLGDGTDGEGPGTGVAALVGFDSKPHLLHDFTHSSEELGEDLKQLEPGDGGAAILDSVSYGVDLLEAQPKEYRRVLLLVSESRDHGSKFVKPERLAQRIGESDVLVLSLTYSAAGAEFIHDATTSGEAGRAMNLLSPLMMAVQAMRKNVAKQIALMSGGEYAPFVVDKGFETRVAEAAKHARNRYLLSFHPTDPAPGLHTIHVQLAQDYGARVVARANYWAADTK